jgi:hypothetical protein
MKMMNTFETKGVLLDARTSKENLLTGKDYDEAKKYIYYTYNVGGVTHGSNSLSNIDSHIVRKYFKDISLRFKKEGAFSIPVFVNKEDNRTSFLINSKDIGNVYLSISIVSILTSIIFYFLL